MDLQEKLQKYANVVVRVGVNLQPGQRLFITGRYGVQFEAAPLVHALERAAYNAGATLVVVNWGTPESMRNRLQHGHPKDFDIQPVHIRDTFVEFMDNGDAILSLAGANPDVFADIDPEILGDYMQRSARVLSGPVSERLSAGVSNWSVAAVPVNGWREKAMPDLSADEFWNLLLQVARISGDDPVADWKAHIAELTKRRDYLQNANLQELHYRGPGTDLRIGLPANHLWHTAQMTAQNGVTHTANLPTEEVFTMPHRARVNGTVQSTRPLLYQGTLMDDFRLTFKDGKVVDVVCKQGEVALHQMLDTDEGARFLGEVALVPHSSPISQTGRIFMSILHDENASCHLALGNAYRFTMTGGPEMSKEDWEAAGGNVSSVHADFMLGSGALDIDGRDTAGKSIPIFRGGEWAFDV